jgi:dTDP-4-dehydrorhamnose 3,5-epimerase
VQLITGNTYTDPRGTIRFVNDFSFEGVKRFYIITHPDTSVIRAWQGHQEETKYFYVVKGSFLINWIKIDNWDKPSQNLKINKQIISDQRSEILKVEAGHANGFKALEPDSTIIIYSDFTLKQSKADDYRFPADYWKISESITE